ncbi:proteasome-activating nucleotidase [Microthyrium microscopicum]|uniref:Proteasome-activating nucleotidase n=1 Tax=Microthyrium microscopicum TaxID=703497 RepID=A0A6A6TY93_9PEZI|nr:proteasome-activating nucleotidase [Microthyrium microscopicum]
MEYNTLSKAPKSNNRRAAYHGLLRHHYPNHFIVNIEAKHVELLDFAAAGYATTTLDTSTGIYDVERKHELPHALTGVAGGFTEEIHFGRYTYTHAGHDFTYYRMRTEDFYERPHALDYILYPRSASISPTAQNSPEIDALLVAVATYENQPHEEIFVWESNWFSRSKSMYASLANARWDDVILAPALKDSLHADVTTFFDDATRALYAQFRLPYKRGLILHGPPGNGKTASIASLVAELSRRDPPVPTLYVKTLKNNCDGDQESMKRLFAHARKIAPCCVVLEDLDSLVHGEVRSFFLNEMDGLDANEGVLLLGSTNHLEKLDVAIRSRPSRFDRKYKFSNPEWVERMAYAKFWRRKLEGAPGVVDFPDTLCALVADLTDGFSFAYMKELFVTSLLSLSRGTKPEELEWDVVGEKSADASDIASDEGDKKKAKKVKPKHEMPKLIIPDHLKSNLLFVHLQYQTQMLIKEMNSNEEVEEEVKKPEKKDTPQSDYQKQLQLLARQNRMRARG